jgi:DNA-binding XRE family transcriptional regulator
MKADGKEKKMTLGEKIKAARKGAGLTQEQLAEKKRK